MVNKKFIKLVTTMFVIVVVSNSFGAFAEDANRTQINQTTATNDGQKNRNKEKAENEVFGKIVSIDATNITIQVATKKVNDDKMQKNENGYERRERGERPEITEEMKQKMKEKRQANEQNEQQNIDNNQTSNKNTKKSFNIEDFVELTGETKTINISQADFGKAIDFSSFKKENNNSNNENANKQNYKDMMENAKDKTYADYKVGDYISIECTDATCQVAKNIREGRITGGRGMRRPMGDRKEMQNNAQGTSNK